MRKVVLVAGAVLSALLLTSFSSADDKPTKAVDAGKVGALAPSPLDNVFEKASTDRNIVDGLINNDLFKKAVKAALKAKQGRQAAIAANPKDVGATPAQAARAAFLRELENSGDDK